MWALLLAGAGGGLTAATVWWILARSMARDAQQLSRRIQQISQGPAGQQDPDIALSTRQTRYSTLPFLGRFLTEFTLADRVLTLLEQAGSRLSVSSFFILHFCAALAAWMLLGLLGSPTIAQTIAVPVAAVIPTFFMLSKRRRRFAQITSQLPDAIRLITSAMRAGLGMEAGLNIVAQEMPDPLREEFKKLLNEWRLYGDMNEAFLHMARRVPTADMRLFVASACLHREVGGNFVEVLEQLEDTVRNRFQLYRELKMLTAESRMSGWILGALPLVVGGALFIMNPGYVELLVEREIGRIMLWISIVLQVIGLFVIKWLTHPKIR